MPTFQQKIAESRGRGYSDDEILDHLEKTQQDIAPKIRESRQAGYGAGEILGHLSTAQPKTAAEKYGVTNPIGKGALDALEGIGAGVMSTVRGASQLAHKVIPAIPEVPAEYADAPDSLMGKAGKFAEQTAEFAVPAGAATKLTKGAGLLARAGAQAAAAGGVSALQTGGDPGATAAGAAAGAAGPVLGAAVKSGAAAIYGGPKGWYQSALKPAQKAMINGTGGRAIQAGLENEIPVSAKGVERLHGLVDDLNTAIENKIQNGATSGKTIDPAAVAQRADQVRGRFSLQVNPEADLAAIDAAKAEFLNGPGAGPIPADMAQKLKQGTYQQIRGSYGKLSSAQVEAQKALARGLKEELVAAFPEIGALNAKESALLGLEPLLEKAVARIGNHQIFGIGTPLAAAGMHAATGSAPIAATAGILRSIIDNPEVKSRLAIALTKAGAGKAATAPIINGRLAALKGAIEASASKLAAREQPTEGLTPAPAQ